MTTIVTIKTSARVQVTSERISEDGRERHPNGVDVIEAGSERSFIVDAGQSIRVVDAPEVPEATTQES